MPNQKRENVSGKEHYDAIFRSDVESEAEWLRMGAAEKTNSIELLLARNGIEPGTILELGCGTGAVITECHRRRLASAFTAIDYSADAIAYLRARSEGSIRCLVGDITDRDLPLDDHFDVVVLSHVLEHIEEPLPFLRSIVRRLRFRYLVVEVPLEDLLASRIKNYFRDRRLNAAGHVQFFTEPSLIRLLTEAGLETHDRRRYVPRLSREAVDFAAHRNGLSTLRTWGQRATATFLPAAFGPLWQRYYYAHVAVLCCPRR